MTLERLGESEPFGSLLLDLLEANGWAIQRWSAFAGGTVITGQKGERRFQVRRPTAAEAAIEAFKRATPQAA